MGYAGFTLEKAAVLIGDPPAEGTAAITHDVHGRITIRVVAPGTISDLFSMLREDRVTITSAPGVTPTVRIDRAVRTMISGTKGYDEFWASTVLVANEVRPPETLAARRYYLTGIRFTDEAVEFDAGGFRWRLQLLENVIETGRLIDAEGPDVVTACLTSEPVALGRAKEVDDAASVITLLLSFAAGGTVSAVRTDEEHEGTVITTRLRMNGSRATGFNLAPILPTLMGPGVIRPFIDACHGPAVTASRTLPLVRLINTLLDLRSEPVVHTKGLLAANFLEVLRYHYALNALVPAGRACQDGDLFYATGEKRPMSFAAILRAFCADIGLNGWKSGFTDFRNRVVHGDDIEGATIREQYANVLEVLHFCDRIILALLDWDRVGGKYIPCVEPERVTPTSYGLNVRPFTR